MLIYELYQGEEYLGQGTSKELSEKFNVARGSISAFSSETFHRRAGEYSRQKIAFIKNPRKIRVEKVKTEMEEKLDLIVELYFEGYDLKTILKTMKEM